MIQTHKDRIWQAGCEQKENQLKELLNNHNRQYMLVDALQPEHNDFGCVQPDFVSDNHFRFRASYENIAPEFWHIYLCDSVPSEQTPSKLYNCLMNRVSGERLLLLCKLYRANLLDQGTVSFNCYLPGTDNDLESRIANFHNIYNTLQRSDFDTEYQELVKQIPLLIDQDPDEAAMSSQISLVVETYTSDYTIAFSEKIFRALQTPRPWLLLCSPNSVCVLRDYEFDLLDDVVNHHSYDYIENLDSRLDALIEELQKPIEWNLDRFEQAVAHNQQRLKKLANDWPQRLSNLLQSTGTDNHS
jgi:hypothetical protein